MTATNALNTHTIGFIGVGLMGKPMARNLHKAGAKLIIYNRSQAVIEELAGEGMIPAASPADVVRQADTTILMLPDTDTVKAILEREDGVLGAVAPGKLIIDMGTTEATFTRAMAAHVEAAGGAYVDAPVSGGTIGAENATLSIMAGGSNDALERARPILEVMGSRVVHVGPVGAGQVAKAANQVIVGLTISAVGEALKLAERAGADPARVREALKGGFADSRILEVHGARMISGDFKPGGKCTTQRKDLDQALKLGREYGLDLPTTALVMGQYERVIEAGFGDLDHAALIKILDLN
ncbi:NAD(P)-dependent oxidoreductase [Magnetovibrio sp.]|uniref:NAD(P)-dependent oxidoreductase n=1 Tax=Magnetovibrio sp. TaxID=2024836 RepID=UPI002F92E5DE